MDVPLAFVSSAQLGRHAACSGWLGPTNVALGETRQCPELLRPSSSPLSAGPCLGPVKQHLSCAILYKKAGVSYVDGTGCVAREPLREEAGCHDYVPLSLWPL